MVARKQFDQRVNPQEFRALQQKLPESRKMTILVCRLEGEPLAAGVCASIGETALQVFLATNHKALAHLPQFRDKGETFGVQPGGVFSSLLGVSV